MWYIAWQQKRQIQKMLSRKNWKGKVEWKRNESVVVLKWRDKRDVLIIFNKHKLELVPVNNWRKKNMKPNIYNNIMSEIDHTDQMLSHYQVSVKAFDDERSDFTLLIHLLPMHPFSTPWKHLKTVRFSDVSWE